MPANGQPLLEAVRNSSREERLLVLQVLLAEFADQGGLSVIPTPGGQYLWAYFVPDAARRPPELTPEDRAELQRRLDAIDDVVDIEEIIAEFRRRAQDSGPES